MKKILNTNNAPEPIGPYNQSVLFNGLLFVSGQIALNPQTNDLVIDNIESETEMVLKNVGAILENAGFTFRDVIKTSVFVKDINDFNSINEVYSRFFTGDYPARELVQVAALPKNVNVEISVIAALK